MGLKAMGKRKVSKTVGKRQKELADKHKAKTFAQLNKAERQERRKKIEEAIAARKTARDRKSPDVRKVDLTQKQPRRLSEKRGKHRLNKKNIYIYNFGRITFFFGTCNKPR